MPTRVLLSRRHFGRRHTATATATATLHGTTPDSLAHTRSIGRREAERVEGVELAGRVRLRFEEGEATEDEGGEEQVAAVEDDRRRAGVGWTCRGGRNGERRAGPRPSRPRLPRRCRASVASEPAGEQAGRRRGGVGESSVLGMGGLRAWLADWLRWRAGTGACVRATDEGSAHRASRGGRASDLTQAASSVLLRPPLCVSTSPLIFPLARTEDTGRSIHAETPTALRSRPSQPLPHTKHVGGSL